MPRTTRSHCHQFDILHDTRQAALDKSSIVSGATIVKIPETKIVGLHPDHIPLSIPCNDELLSQHQAGQFEWLLSFPAARSSSHPDIKKLYFGCNVLHRRTQSGDTSPRGRPENIYTLLATPVHGDESSFADSSPVAEQKNRIMAAGVDAPRPANGMATKPSAPHVEGDIAVDKKENGNVVPHVPPRSKARPITRIEDSVEALDKLEEELEALNEVAQLDRVLSPETSKPPVGKTTTAPTLKRNTSTKKPANNPGTATSGDKPANLARQSSVRKAAEGTTNSEPQRPAIKRPASLLPPKPPAKSSKQPTMPTFELPGEAVARRLKEQREARLSQQITAEQAAAAVASAVAAQRPKSSKQPTRPTFELPGEAISRRKREAQEAKLRAQEEEERRRREFKARPVRNSIAPGSYPRETISSRARQTKAVLAENSAAQGADASAASKRHSLAVHPSSRPPLSTTASSGNVTHPKPQSRGRDTGAASPSSAAHHPAAGSRAASSSTGSTASGKSKRSAVSTEDAEKQRLRGARIYHRDNSYAAERERERLEREAAARQARAEAAERSRQLSREWAEKQRVKKGGAGAAVAEGSPAAAAY